MAPLTHRLESALLAHMAYGAGAIDPGHDALAGQLLGDQACAVEGAQPASATGANLTPTQQAALLDAATEWPWLSIGMAVVAVLSALASALWPLGAAS